MNTVVDPKHEVLRINNADAMAVVWRSPPSGDLSIVHDGWKTERLW